MSATYSPYVRKTNRQYTNKTGRPPKYNDTLAHQILQAFAQGKTYADICREHNISHETLYEWERSRPEFAEGLARARELRAENFADQVVVIADDCAGDYIELPNGRLVPNNAKVQRDRLRCDMRWRLMEKLNPQRYGQQQRLELTGAGGGPLLLEQITLVAMAERASAQKAPQVIDNEGDQPKLSPPTHTPTHK